MAKRKPTVLHITLSLGFGGVEKHLELIARHGGERFEHRFLALAGGGIGADRLQAAGARVKLLGESGRPPSIPTIIALARYLRQETPDLVHCHGIEGNFHGLIAARLAGIKTRIAEEIGIPVHSTSVRLTMKSVYRLAWRVIGVAEGVRRWLVQSGEVKADRAVAINNPVALHNVRAAQRGAGAPLRIIFVGRLEKVKNVDVLLEAAVELIGQGHDIEVTVVGAGTESARLEKIANDPGSRGRIQMVGYQADPAPFLARAHVCVQPGMGEGLSLLIVEAMGCGLPVITPAMGGSPDLVTTGQTGWLIETAERRVIVEALRTASAMPGDELARMGRRARESVIGRFEIAGYIEQVESLYERGLRSTGATQT